MTDHGCLDRAEEQQRPRRGGEAHVGEREGGGVGKERERREPVSATGTRAAAQPDEEPQHDGSGGQPDRREARGVDARVAKGRAAKERIARKGDHGKRGQANRARVGRRAGRRHGPVGGRVSRRPRRRRRRQRPVLNHLQRSPLLLRLFHLERAPPSRRARGRARTPPHRLRAPPRCPPRPQIRSDLRPALRATLSSRRLLLHSATRRPRTSVGVRARIPGADRPYPQEPSRPGRRPAAPRCPAEVSKSRLTPD